LGELVTGRIGGISACDAIVIIVWGYDGCTDGSSSDAHGHTTAHVGSAINPAAIDASRMNAPAIDTPRVNTTRSICGSIGQSIGGETCDAENGGRGD
jgi:hypothetical protein